MAVETYELHTNQKWHFESGFTRLQKPQLCNPKLSPKYICPNLPSCLQPEKVNMV